MFLPRVIPRLPLNQWFRRVVSVSLDQFNVLDEAGTSFATNRSVLDQGGTPFAVPATVLDQDGTGFVVI